jgi:hypothetical protein
MRRWVVALVLGAFALWALVKVVPFLKSEKPEIFATPTVQPIDPATLALVDLKRDQRVCLNQMEYGPKARYVGLTLKSRWPSGPISIEARAPGYLARARQTAGVSGNAPVTIPIKAAGRAVDGGTLCVSNEGRHMVSLYAVNPGRGSSPATTTVDGEAITQQLSVTLLTSPAKSLGSRLGEIFDHVAAFRPVTGWEVWLLALLAFLGLPVALGFALARSLAEDDANTDQR